MDIKETSSSIEEIIKQVVIAVAYHHAFISVQWVLNLFTESASGPVPGKSATVQKWR